MYAPSFFFYSATSVEVSQIIMLGNADDIILYLCSKLTWELPSSKLSVPDTNTKKRSSGSRDTVEPERVAERYSIVSILHLG